MKQENDYILREVQKLTLSLTNLISSVKNLGEDEINTGIQETDDFIRKEWNLSIKDIIALSDAELINKFDGSPEIHVDKLVELLYEIVRKISKPESIEKLNKKELALKGISLLDRLNQKSTVYSMERMEIKDLLQQQIRA